jgi:hypothetical protein
MISQSLSGVSAPPGSRHERPTIAIGSGANIVRCFWL